MEDGAENESGQQNPDDGGGDEPDMPDKTGGNHEE